jgi:hypothetical protein
MTTAYLPFIQNSLIFISRVLSKYINLLAYHPGKSFLEAYTASCACVTKCTLDKWVIPSRPGSRNARN